LLKGNTEVLALMIVFAVMASFAVEYVLNDAGYID
jgi:hypothetical protein